MEKRKYGNGKKRGSKKVSLIQAILDLYQSETTEDMNNIFKNLFDPILEAMFLEEMSLHLDYDSCDKKRKKNDNCKVGYRKKTLKIILGKIENKVSRYQDCPFEPSITQSIKKTCILSEYDQGMSRHAFHEAHKIVCIFK